MIDVRSYGAAGTVTGSCHLVETGAGRLLLDCGLFQGTEELWALNHAPFGFDAATIDAVVLSHAHLDHAGRLPLLVRRGFAGPILATEPTRLIAEHLLLDAAKLQHEERERDRRHGRTPDAELYTEDDVHAALERFVPLRRGEGHDVAGATVTTTVAGHVPGSVSIAVATDAGRLVFSGDLGNDRKQVMPDPEPCPEADLVLVESTYGDRDHRPFEQTLAELAGILRDAADRGGKILIPTFALERTHDVLYHLARMEEEHAVPALPVWVDSPLARRIDAVYDVCAGEFSDEVRLLYRNGRDPFHPKRLAYTGSVDDSKRINAAREPMVVIAGSGMMTGGRILHHLRAHLDDPSTTVVIVGFQPGGGLGRRLVDGAPSVRILGQEVRVRARIATVGGFSAHADRSELLRWLASSGDAAIRLVHGEPKAIAALGAELRRRGRSAEPQPSAVRLPGPGRRDEGGE